MAKHVSRFLPVVLFAAVAMTVSAAPTKLALKYEKGETWEQVIKIKMKGTAGPAGQQMPLDMTMTMRMASEVLDVKPDGAVEMTQVFKEFKMGGMPGMGGEMDIGQMMGMGDKPINLTLDRKGQVVKIEGLDDLSAGGMPGGMMDNPDSFDQPFLSDKPVEIGDTWQDKSESSVLGSSGEGERIRDYVLRDIKEMAGLKVAIIGVKEKSTVKDATVKSKPMSMGGDVEMTSHINLMTIEQDGEMLFDIVSGRFLGSQLLMKMDQDISISPGGQGQQLSMTIRMDMDVTEVYNYGDTETPDLSALYTKRETPVAKKTEAEEPSTSPQPVSVSAQLDRAKADMKALATALEMFFIDNNTYPLALEGRTIDKAGIKVGEGERARIVRLTTPISYISQIPPDPFNPDGNTYRYFSDGISSYVLVSDGPDQKPDYDERQYKGERLSDLNQFAYNPAQGEESSGDIIRVGP